MLGFSTEAGVLGHLYE